MGVHLLLNTTRHRWRGFPKGWRPVNRCWAASILFSLQCLPEYCSYVKSAFAFANLLHTVWRICVENQKCFLTSMENGLLGIIPKSPFSFDFMRQNRLISFLSHELGADEGTWTHMKLPSLEPESSASASSATSAYMWTRVTSWSRFFCCSFPNQHVRFYHETFFLSTCFWKKITVFLRVAEMARTAVKPLRSAAARFRAFRL